MDWSAIESWLTKVNWLAFAALLSATGTLIVAAITFINVRILRGQINLIERQTNLIERQTIIQRSSIYPLLEWDSVKNKKNSVYILLTNKGKGPALHIGLANMFHHCKYPTGAIADSNYLYDIKENRRIYPSEVVSIMRTSGGKSRLHPKETDEFRGEIMFRYTPYATLADFPSKDLLRGKRVYAYKDYTFDELKALMAENKLRFIYAFIHIVYKDISEQILEIEPLYRVIVDFGKHKNMQEAIKNGMVPRWTQMSLDEIPQFSWDNYKNFRSKRSFLDDFSRFER
jgi:hypothetical protein